jgi:lysophospholipase L1-like esterase
MHKTLLLLFVFFIFSCAPPDQTESLKMTNTPPAAPKPAGASHRYLALGDSYTIGQSVSINVRFPILLTKALRAEGFAMDDPQIIAQTGWTTGELSKAIDKADPQGPYDLVTLLIGVNNQYRGYDIGEYQVEFNALLQRSIAFAAGDATHVIVISIPDWGVTPYAGGRDEQKIAEEIDAFNAVNRSETQAAGARYVNVTDISRLAIEDRTLIARDGLHPAGKMYTLWVEEILAEALDILKK